MNTNRFRMLSLFAAATVFSVSGAQVIDGSMGDAVYGAPLAIQNNATGFGNSNLGMTEWANGSELDALYGYADDNYLYLGLAGNLETSYNKFVIFFDSPSLAGQNILTSPQPDIDFGYLNNMAGTDGFGLTFEPGFNAGLALNVTNGDTSGQGTYGLFANLFNVGATGGYPGGGAYLGTHGAGGSVLSGGDDNMGIEVAINNSNTGGVSDNGGNAWQFGGVDSGAGVLTGAEFKVPFAVLQSECDIKIVAALTGGGGEYWSNQVLGTLDGTYGNLGFFIGNAPLINLATLNGNQTIYLRPSSRGLVHFGDFVGAVEGPATVKWFDANMNLVYSRSANIIDGTLDTCGPVRPGVYSICVKTRTFLSKMITVDLSNGRVTGLNWFLTNGDIDGDDEVGPGDFGLLSGAYGSVDGDPNWDANADLDGDGEVGPNDFGILSSNYGLTGDCP